MNIEYSLLLFCLSLLINFKCTTSADDLKLNFVDEGRKFRTLKYQDIWKQALKKVEKKDLDELARILHKLDKVEITIKHQKSSGDYDKSLEQSTRNYLVDILERYGLMDGPNRKDLEKVTFEDERLNGMWEKAISEAEYSTDELEDLHQEFKHMQQKMKDFKHFSDKVSKHKHAMNEDMTNEAHIESNHVDFEQDLDDERQASKKLKKMTKQLKDEYHELNEKVQVLESNVYERVHNPGKKFTDPRVVELWSLAQNSGKFSNEELSSVEEELGHFQNRISKLRHWERIHGKLHKQVNDLGYSDEETKKEYQHAQDQLSNHKRYVKKFHGTMLDRVYHRVEL